MRLLVDTNILISALFFGRFSKQFLNELLEKNFEVCINDIILAEYEKIIHRKITKKKILDEKLYTKFLSKVSIFEIKPI